MILYFFLVIVNLIGTVLTFPLAFIIGILYSTQIGWCNNGTVWQSGPRLLSFLSWFQTPDNSLDGDQTFRAAHNPCWCLKFNGCGAIRFMVLMLNTLTAQRE